MPLTPKAKEILKQIQILNPDSKYIFIRNSQPLATVTFNRRLKKCCEELSIEYCSSHKLRFSTASIMYKNGMEDTELQKLLGHTSLNMTHHYLWNITSQEETASTLKTSSYSCSKVKKSIRPTNDNHKDRYFDNGNLPL